MAQRKSVSRMDTELVQGPGSFIEYRPMEVGEMEELLAAMAESTPPAEKLAAARRLVAATVVNWDWVDEKGVPFPSPADDPDVTKRLYANELMFVVKNLQTGMEDEAETKKK